MNTEPNDFPQTDTQAAIVLSYEHLPEELKWRFRELGVFVGAFNVTHALAVWGEEQDQKELDGMVNRGLVERVGGGRYRLPDHARLLSISRLLEMPDEARRAVRRHAEYYLQSGEYADGLYRMGGVQAAEGARMFVNLWPELKAAWRRMSGQVEGWPQIEGYDAWLNRFPEAIENVDSSYLMARTIIAMRHQGLEAARQLGDKIREGRHLANLGMAYGELGETRPAIEYFEQALSAARELGDRRAEGHLLENLGSAYDKLGELERAGELWFGALDIYDELNDPMGNIVADWLLALEPNYALSTALCMA